LFPQKKSRKRKKSKRIMPLLNTVALVLCASALTGTAAAATANGNVGRAAPQPYVNYSAVTGYFLQDEPDTNPTTFDYVLLTHVIIL
jgi:hypothetical protein